MHRKSPLAPGPKRQNSKGSGLSSREFDRPPEGFRDHLVRVFEGLGAPLPSPAILEGLETYLDEVIRWGRRVDLVAPRTLDELVELSFADAIVLANAERQQLTAGTGARFVDVGTGGGAPGIPFAILLSEMSDCSFLFVEPRDKRVAFLNHVLGRLQLPGCRVIRGRSESLEETYDVALSRATLPPPEWVLEGARLAEVVWLLLAREEVPPHEGLRLDQSVEYVWPLRNIPHRAVRFVRA